MSVGTLDVPLGAEGASLSELVSRGVRTGRSMLRRPRIMFSLAVIAVVIVCAAFPQLLAPYDPLKPDIAARLGSPMIEKNGLVHALGTDSLGRDTLSRIIYGARISAVVGASAVALAGVIGVILGLLAGFYGGAVDAAISRLGDVALAVPYLVLAIGVVAVFGGGLPTVIAVLALSTWMTYTRIVRAEVLAVRHSEFIEAARSIGARPARLMFRHILPNVSSSIIVIASQQLAAMILFEAALSFLGLGVGPPTPSWGSMVADGRLYVANAWWVSTLPGFAILLTVLAANWLGDWVRDALDPRRIHVESHV
ncbi:MAG TPA: ABC transporter permease [Chloroflexota bacterium]|nr:ABC transporter permease [Chloroflexota bacterium]